jgi:hypothetical protein
VSSEIDRARSGDEGAIEDGFILNARASAIENKVPASVFRAVGVDSALMRLGFPSFERSHHRESCYPKSKVSVISDTLSVPTTT